jgi:hypothetical protein
MASRNPGQHLSRVVQRLEDQPAVLEVDPGEDPPSGVLHMHVRQRS